MTDFWTKRRAAAAAETRTEEAKAVAAQTAAREAEIAEMSDAALLEAHDLPDPQTLNIGDDFTRFMQAAVPARLKTMALRRLWRVNPALANLDGLVDYGEDFSLGNAGTPGMKTTYQVGRGMLAHVEEMARQALAKESPEPEEPLAEAEDEAVAEELGAAQSEMTLADPDDDGDEADPPAGPPRHRMQFKFEDARTA